MNTRDSSDDDDDYDNGTVATSLTNHSSWQGNNNDSCSSLPPMSTIAGTSTSPGANARQRGSFMATRTSITNALISPMRVAQRLSLSVNNGGVKRRTSTTNRVLDALVSPDRGSTHRRKSLIEKAGESVKRMSLRRPLQDDDSDSDDDDSDEDDDDSDDNNDSEIDEDELELSGADVSRDEVLAALVCRELEMMDC